MKLKEFSSMAPTLDFLLLEARGLETKCLLVDGGNWHFHDRKLGEREIISIYQNITSKDVIVLVK